jgi:hypothetical protein
MTQKIPEAINKGLAAGHFESCEWVIMAVSNKTSRACEVFVISIITHSGRKD